MRMSMRCVSLVLAKPSPQFTTGKAKPLTQIEPIKSASYDAQVITSGGGGNAESLLG